MLHDNVQRLQSAPVSRACRASGERWEITMSGPTLGDRPAQAIAETTPPVTLPAGRNARFIEILLADRVRRVSGALCDLRRRGRLHRSL